MSRPAASEASYPVMRDDAEGRLVTGRWLTALRRAIEGDALPARRAVAGAGLEAVSGDVAVHLAALLAHLNGPASEPFGPDQRPFFLTFKSEDRLARAAAIDELRRRIFGAWP